MRGWMQATATLQAGLLWHSTTSGPRGSGRHAAKHRHLHRRCAERV